MMELIKRDKCVLNNSDDLELLYNFKQFPMFMGCTDKNQDTDIKIDMEWDIDKHSRCIQLRNLIPLEKLYEHSHGSGAIGELWNKHHVELANFINKFNINSVLEIGG